MGDSGIPITLQVLSESISLDFTMGRWKGDVIRNEFSVDEAEAILNIQLFNGNREDKLIWHPSCDGRYSAKSAYRKIWRSFLPPRVRLFAWRLCNGILPTAANVARRLNSPETCCNVVAQEMHALRDCYYSKLTFLPASSPSRL